MTQWRALTELLTSSCWNVNFAFNFLPKNTKQRLLVGFNKVAEDGLPQRLFFLEQVLETRIRGL